MEVPEADEGKCKRIRNYIGVYLRSTGKWVAEFRDNKIGVRKWLGTFDTAEDAAMAFDKFSLKFYGHKGKLNFPERATHEADLQHVSHPTGNETRKKGSTCKHAEEAGRAYDKAALKKQNRNGQKERLNFLDREVNSHVSCAHSVEFVTSAEGICKTSGNYIGVHLRSTGKWGAEFRDNKIGVRKWLGTFNTAEDAAMAFDKASLKFHGHKAKLNFPGRATHEVDPQHASHPTGNETRKKCMSVQIARTHDSNKNGDVGLGTFKPAEEVAEMAYDKAALKKQNRNGQKARLNFPDGEVDSHVYVDQFVTSDAKRKRASQSSPGKRTRTKYIGVHQESSGMWRAQIRDPIKCASVRLGTFGTAEAAAMAFDEAALKLRGCKASLNFPDRDAASYRPSKRNCDSQSGAKSTFLSDKGQNHQSFLELPQHEHQNVVQPESSSQPNENYVLSSFWGDLSELDSYLEQDRAISSMIDALKEAIQRAFRCKN